MALELARTLHQRPELGLKLRCVFVDESCGDQAIDERRARRFARSPAPRSARAATFATTSTRATSTSCSLRGRRTRPASSAMLDDLRDTTSSVYLIPDVSLYDLIQARVGDVDGIPVIALCESPLHGARGALKRFTDIVFATLAARRRGAADAADRARDQARFAGPRVLQAGPLRARWRAHRRLQVQDDDRVRERRSHRAGEAQRRARDARRPHSAAHVARRAAAADQRAARAHEPRRAAAACRRAQRGVSQADLRLHGAPQSDSGDHRPRAGQRLPRRDLDARRHAPARAIRPRVLASLVLAARHQDHVAHARCCSFATSVRTETEGGLDNETS